MRTLPRSPLFLVLLPIASGCSSPSERPADLARAPDLGLVELCPPKGLPPGMISRDEQQRRDAERANERDEKYRRSLDEWKKKNEADRKAAEVACDAALDKLGKGKPLDEKDPRE